MIGKVVYVLALLVSVVVIVNAVPEYNWRESRSAVNISNHLIVGQRAFGDRLVLRQKVTKNSSWLRKVTTEQTFHISAFERITQVKALDQKINGKGATAAILKGGPGVSAVTMKFKSLRGHGINFVVEIYAKP